MHSRTHAPTLPLTRALTHVLTYSDRLQPHVARVASNCRSVQAREEGVMVMVVVVVGVVIMDVETMTVMVIRRYSIR